MRRTQPPPTDNGGGTLLHTSPSFKAQVHFAPPPARSEVHPARGVRQGVACDEPTRRRLRRNRFALTGPNFFCCLLWNTSLGVR